MNISEKKFTEFANKFCGEVKRTKKLLIDNGFIQKVDKKFKVTKTGKELMDLVKKELKK